MKVAKVPTAVWVSMIAGLLTGAVLKPIILPSGFSGLHGMGPVLDIALAGFGLGFTLIACALLTRYSRTIETRSAAAPKKNNEFERNMMRIERKIGAVSDKVTEITSRVPVVANC